MEETSNKLGLKGHSTYSNWEYDRTKPDPEMIAKMSQTFGVSLEFLINGVEEESSFVDNIKRGPAIAEQTATYQTIITTNYDELLDKISKEFDLDLSDPADQDKLINALHIVIKIHGALK